MKTKDGVKVLRSILSEAHVFAPTRAHFYTPIFHTDVRINDTESFWDRLSKVEGVFVIRDKSGDIFRKEHDLEDRAAKILNDPPESLEAWTEEYSALFKAYKKLVRQSEKMTRLADSGQNKLMRLKNKLEEQNEQIKEQQQALVEANHLLQEASLTDNLTGLRNRRFVEDFLKEDVERILRAHTNGPPEETRNLLFVALDIDFFKKVNDTYGHSSGDRVLKAFSDVLKSNCRKGDIAARWGGEEFFLICRDADRAYGHVLAERLREQIASEPFFLEDGSHIKLTCSIGFAFFPFFVHFSDLLRWEEVVHLADQALYAAKKYGRNAWVGLYPICCESCQHVSATDPNFLAELEEKGCLEVYTSLTGHKKTIFS